MLNCRFHEHFEVQFRFVLTMGKELSNVVHECVVFSIARHYTAHRECMRHHFDVMHSDIELTGACQYMQLCKDGRCILINMT